MAQWAYFRRRDGRGGREGSGGVRCDLRREVPAEYLLGKGAGRGCVWELYNGCPWVWVGGRVGGCWGYEPESGRRQQHAWPADVLSGHA